jgi:hypothetical protein
MRSLLRRYARIATAALIAVLSLSMVPRATFAAGPGVNVFGTSTALCTPGGRPVAAVVQGEQFDVSLADFPTNQVGISFTFPDGRVLSPRDAANLDGVNDYPFLFPAQDTRILDPIDAAASFVAQPTWPTGCYTITVAEVAATGLPAGLKASAQLVLLPKPHPIQAGNVKLSVQAAGTYQPTGPQGVTVNIFGHNVRTNNCTFSIDIVQPNGAIIAIPSNSIAVNQGDFKTAYTFTQLHRTGIYTIYATSVTPSGVTNTVKAQFTLTATPAGVAGRATLTIIDPFTTLVKHGTPISIQGRLFTPGRTIDITLVLPGGARITQICVAAVDPSGNVPIPTLYLGRHFPTGLYQLIVTDGLRTTSTSWHLVS